MAETRITSWEEEIGGACPGVRVLCFDSLGSTMDRAREELGASESDVLIIARSQTAGRGRQGRPWSEAGQGLYATYGFKSKKPLADFAGFSLAVGAVIAPILMTLGAEVRLKWPNDIVTPDRRKLGGILIEAFSNKDSASILVGIGINIAAPASELTDAAALADFNLAPPGPPAIAGLVLPALMALKVNFEKFGFGAYKDKWLSLSLPLGAAVRIEDGGAPASGSYSGVSASGALVLRTAEGFREFSGGHILSWG